MMLRAESTLISCVALLAPQFLLLLPLQAFFNYGLWIMLVQLAGLLVLVQPLVFCELALGQRSQYGPLKCWCFGPAWKGIGFLMLVTTALELTSVNVDIVDYLREQHGIDEKLYFQLALWAAMVPMLTWWPKVTSKLWVFGSLVCVGGVVALSARSLTLDSALPSLRRLWRLSAQVPDDLLELVRVSLLPCLSASGSGVLIVLGSYRWRHTNVLLDSGLMAACVFVLHAVHTLGTAGLAAHHCAVRGAGDNRSLLCQMHRLRCPMLAISATKNSSCDLLAHYKADSADRPLGGAQLYAEMLGSLPRNQVSPALWLWTWRSVLAWLHATYLLVRADTWVRAIADKLQGARPMRKKVWTARLVASLLTCGIMGSAAWAMCEYRTPDVQQVYRMSTVRWLPLLLAALTCLAVTHGYGGVRFIKEVGGGVALRPWFFVLVGFVTPALAIGLAGLRMHVSIQQLLWPHGGYPAYNRLSESLGRGKGAAPNQVSLLLAVSAFLFLLAGLFSPLVWHGLCRRQRCIDLVQPTKSWQRARHSSEDSNGANGGDVIRDLGTTTMEETPMLQGARQQAGGSGAVALPNPTLSNPILSDQDLPLPPPPPLPQHQQPQSPLQQQQEQQQQLLLQQQQEPRPVMYMNAKPMQPVRPLEVETPTAGLADGYGTVRFQHPGSSGVAYDAQRPAVSSASYSQASYSTATLPARDKQRGEIRFNLNEDNPTSTGTKTLNRGILKNKHQGDSFRQQYPDECIPLRGSHADNPYNARAEMYRGGQGEIL